MSAADFDFFHGSWHIEHRLRGYHHATIRLYEPDADEWALYWITSAGGSVIEPPHGF